MKKLAALIVCSMISFACGPYVDPQPVGPDLATAPIGGEYIGVGQLDYDSCNGYDKNNELDKEYFEPFFIDVKMHSKNEEHSEVTFGVGQVQLENVKPLHQVTDGVERYVFDYEFVEEGGLHLSVLSLDGTLAAGEMHLAFAQNLYEGTKDDRGDVYCDALYRLHAKKVVNYPYVRP